MAFEYTNIPAVLRRSDSDPIVSASNNDVEGIGFFATTSARDLLSDRLRQSNFLAIIGTDIYVYTGTTFTPSGVDDFIADEDWTDSDNWETVSGSSGAITIADVTNLQTELTSLSSGIDACVTQTDFDSHVFAISDVNGLQAALDAKAASVHGHAIGDITNLTTELAGKADSSHNHDSDYAAIGHTHNADDVTHTRGATNWDVGLWIDALFTANTAQDSLITANNTRSLLNQSNVTTNTASISTNATGISTNASAISTNATDIGTNTTALSTSAGLIATNITNIAGNTSDISTNASGISTNAGGISTNASDISTNATDIAAKANTADLATVATSGSYNDLSDLPSGGGFSGDYDDLTNKPDLSLLATESDLTTAEGLIADNTTALGTKANSADLEAVATSGNYNDLNNTPDPFELKFTTDFTITDPVGKLVDNHEVLEGENIEDYLIEMVTSYQNPVASIATYGNFTSSFFTMVHGTTFSASGVSYALTNIGNVNTSDAGSLAFTDSHTSNQTRSFTPAASGTVSFSPSISAIAKVTTSTGGTGAARSRSNAFKITMSGMTNSNGVAINTLTRKGTIVYRSRLCRSSTNYFSGITNAQAQTLWASSVSTQNSSNPFSSYTSTNGVTASQYLYVMVPESIHTFNGGTTTGVGTMEIGFQGAVTSTTVPVWCGTATFAPIGSSMVKYHVLRIGGVGAYADSTKVKFA